MWIRSMSLVLGLVSFAAPAAIAGKTERVSVDSKETETPIGLSDSSSISATGRFAAFDSRAATLVPGDTNGLFDIFVRDRAAGKTARVSVSSSGEQAVGGASYFPSISGNGRFIAFESSATNLVKDDTNDAADVFVHDRETRKTTRVSVRSDGTQGNAFSDHCSISSNGRFVVFESGATNLVEGDTNLHTDIFVHDRKLKTTTRVSVGSNGEEADDFSAAPSISAKGRAIVFSSGATNLVPGDTNGKADVFLRDLKHGTTVRISLDMNGAQITDASCDSPSISANGRCVAFISNSASIVPLDTNGTYDVFVLDRKTQTVTRESVDSAGAEGNGSSDSPSLSRTGRALVFESSASNLVDDDTDGFNDSFLRDRKTGKTLRVSVGPHGVQATHDSYYASISANGRCAIFSSEASNLVPGDTNSETDIFVHERN